MSVLFVATNGIRPNLMRIRIDLEDSGVRGYRIWWAVWG